MIADALRCTEGFSNTEIFSLKMDTPFIKVEACCMIFLKVLFVCVFQSFRSELP